MYDLAVAIMVILTISFIMFLPLYNIYVKTKGQKLNFFSALTLPLSFAILLYLSIGFLAPKEQIELTYPLVSIDGKSPISELSPDGKVEISVYNKDMTTVGFIQVDDSSIKKLRTEEESFLHLNYFYIKNEFLYPYFALFSKEDVELYINNKSNMTHLLLDNYLHLAGYNENDVNKLSKIKEELESLEKSLSESDNE